MTSAWCTEATTLPSRTAASRSASASSPTLPTKNQAAMPSMGRRIVCRGIRSVGAPAMRPVSSAAGLMATRYDDPADVFLKTVRQEEKRSVLEVLAARHDVGRQQAAHIVSLRDR